MNFLTGYKTYILATIAGVFAVLYALGDVSALVAQTVIGLTGFGSIITLRVAVSSAVAQLKAGTVAQ